MLQHGQVLGKESERLIVRQEQKIVREIPAIKVDQIMVFGNAQITTQAMQFFFARTHISQVIRGVDKAYRAMVLR